jgi:hypothetical protein
MLTAVLVMATACSGSADEGQAIAGQLSAPQSQAGAEGTTSSAASVAGAAGPTSSSEASAMSDPAEAEGDADQAEADSDQAKRPTTTAPSAGPTLTRPDWLGTRVLPTGPDGFAEAQPTPPELVDRRLPTIDTLPAPTSEAFQSSIEPLAGDPLARSTWNEDCPVTVDDLRYLRVTFWGFDERPHQGELVVHATVTDDMVSVFQALYDARYPIEEMRIVTQADLDAPPTGDGNNTTAFVCRAVTGGTRFSEHAYGLAIDINPFLNPYQAGNVVLPELAGAYLDRTGDRDGVILEGGVVVQAFDAIGWGWGGRWSSLKDYQHFALNDR